MEFAQLLHIFFLLVIVLIEFSFVWNSRNTVLFATRDGSMLAAEGGNNYGTDCVVLDRVEKDIISPASAIKVQQVQIYWSDRNGAQIGTSVNTYTRTGATTCDYGDGTTLTVPYTLASGGYPEGSRCDVLAGCGGSAPTLDTTGVKAACQHRWDTPFARPTRTGVGLTGR